MTTFTIACTCGCGESVKATDAGFAATSVEVAACSRRSADGVASVNVRKSVAYAAAIPADTIRHSTGLVTFG